MSFVLLLDIGSSSFFSPVVSRAFKCSPKNGRSLPRLYCTAVLPLLSLQLAIEHAVLQYLSPLDVEWACLWANLTSDDQCLHYDAASTGASTSSCNFTVQSQPNEWTASNLLGIFFNKAIILKQSIKYPINFSFKSFFQSCYYADPDLLPAGHGSWSGNRTRRLHLQYRHRH